MMEGIKGDWMYILDRIGSEERESGCHKFEVHEFSRVQPV